MASSPEAQRGNGARVVCAGVAVVDNIYRLDHFPKPGTKTRARDFEQGLGGCAANAAVAVARLGGRAQLVSPLGGPHGRDLTGDNILAHLAREGVDARGVVRIDGAASSLSSIQIDPSGERLIVNYRDPKLETARPADPRQSVARADAVLVDNRFPDFVLPIARAARERSIPVVLDGDQPTRLTDELLNAVTHVVFSADGLRTTARSDNLETALRTLSRHIAAFVAVTDGARDMIWQEDGALRRLPAFAVTTVDTLAAGDVFHGAFALALAERQAILPAMRFAAAAAAIKCTRFGGGAGCPTRPEVSAFIAERT